MGQRTLVMLGVVLGLGLGLAVYAADTPLAVHGTITAVDQAAKTLTVRAGKVDQVLKLADTATIVFDGKPVAFDTLKKGDHVKVDYSVQGTVKTATKIIVARAPQHMQQRPQAMKPSSSAPAPAPKK